MTWLMLSLRRMQLKTEISDLQADLVNISRDIQDLADFSNSIADGVITYSEMASCPSSLFGTQLGFIADSSSTAYQSATTKTSAYIQQLSQTGSLTGNQYLYAMGTTDGTSYDTATIFNEIYKKELSEYATQVCDQYVNELEKEYETEQTRIQTQLDAKEAELSSYDDRISQNIQDGAIKL